MNINLAPFDGELYLTRAFYPKEPSDQIYQSLLDDLEWQQEQLIIYGKWVQVPRLMAWYGDVDAHYRYSGVDHQPNPWTDCLKMLKTDLKKACRQPFNSVLANLYRNERDSMGSHSDHEKELGKNPVIASLSFGETRLLRFRHRQSGYKLDLELVHGDLLIMAGELQQHWRHELPKTKQPKNPRINLTFRRIMPVPT